MGAGLGDRGGCEGGRSGGQRSSTKVSPDNADRGVLLSTQSDVRALASTAVAQGLRRKGYRVIDGAEAAAADAIPIEIDIREFWGWFEEDTARRSMYLRTRLVLTSAHPAFENGRVIESLTRLNTGSRFPTGRNWRNTLIVGFERLIDRVARDVPVIVE